MGFANNIIPAWMLEEMRAAENRALAKYDLPKPECRYGYTTGQLRTILEDRFEEFFKWMYGQTMSLCDGRSYNHETKEYEKGCDEPHGPVVYSHDLRRFLLGLPVID